MKSASNIVSSIHNMRKAYDHNEDFIRSNPGGKGAKLFAGYNKRLEWIYKDLLTHPFLTDEVREGVRREWNSDCFSPSAIDEKTALLNPEQRELVETMIDALLKGEEVKFEQV